MNPSITRRNLLSLAATGALSGWLGRVAAHAADEPATKSCILLWMSGGPSHLDTFDLKPDATASVRGEFRAIDTSVPGIQISEHFPKFSQQMDRAALLRSMNTVESDHQLASYHLHTGYQKRAGGVSFPTLGATVSRELGSRGDPDFPLPHFVCIGEGPRHFVRSGFLGPDHQPLDILRPDRGTEFLVPLLSQNEFERQYRLLQGFNTRFEAAYQAESARAHTAALDRAVRLMTADQKRALDLSQESAADRDRYGSGSFGQGCLLARRLVEAGVRFVEVMMGDGVGWDTHRDNFPRTKSLSLEADTAMAALIDDLKDRGRLDSTLVIWMGEFGRSPQITTGGGRNHWARAWSSVLVGGGIRGGQVIGRTDKDAAQILDRPISVSDFLATVCKVLGIDSTRENRVPNLDRPIAIVDGTKAVTLISELF